MWFLLLTACPHTPDPVAGEAVYRRTCVSCHGDDGAAGVQVDGVAASDLATVVPTLDDDTLDVVVVDGIGAMPAQNLDPIDAADCVAWLREAFPAR